MHLSIRGDGLEAERKTSFCPCTKPPLMHVSVQMKGNKTPPGNAPLRPQLYQVTFAREEEPPSPKWPPCLDLHRLCRFWPWGSSPYCGGETTPRLPSQGDPCPPQWGKVLRGRSTGLLLSCPQAVETSAGGTLGGGGGRDRTWLMSSSNCQHAKPPDSDFTKPICLCSFFLTIEELITILVHELARWVRFHT